MATAIIYEPKHQAILILTRAGHILNDLRLFCSFCFALDEKMTCSILKDFSVMINDRYPDLTLSEIAFFRGGQTKKIVFALKKFAKNF